MARILVVDDEHKIRRQICELLSEQGHGVDQAERVEQSLEKLQTGIYDLLITDVRLPDRSGIELLTQAQTYQPAIQTIVITAYGSVEDAVEAMRLGAFDYIQKPFQLEALRLVVEQALSMATLKAQHQYMLDETRTVRGGPDLVGSSTAMARVRELIDVASSKPTSVMLTGESGTGKELVAGAVHHRSGKGDRPLVRLNCPAIPVELFESELFGHMKGSFTGAFESRRGKFELADGGTLFLDEISEIPLGLQSKLLRVLEERRFTRVGGTNEIQVNLRVIAATNRDLERAVQTGRFRKDLYYRLNIFPIHIPPLREHLEDIPDLADHLLQRIATQYHMPQPGISEHAMRHLQRYGWPGNVRELRNVLERGLLLAQGEAIQPEHLPAELIGDDFEDPQSHGLNQQVETYRKDLILRALQRCDWRKKEAARLLGLSPRALSHYIVKYDLDGLKP
jgi:DNA-binding NtrC family response regulator